MATFWQLLKESVIVQALMVLMVLGAVVYLATTGGEIPDVLAQMAMLIAGFYFGAKSVVSTQIAMRETIEALTKNRKPEDI